MSKVSERIFSLCRTSASHAWRCRCFQHGPWPETDPWCATAGGTQQNVWVLCEHKGLCYKKPQWLSSACAHEVTALQPAVWTVTEPERKVEGAHRDKYAGWFYSSVMLKYYLSRLVLMILTKPTHVPSTDSKILKRMAELNAHKKPVSHLLKS